jgi:hypothetical protein
MGRGLVPVLLAIRVARNEHENQFMSLDKAPRTGTRPPHPLLSSPCPYSEGNGRCPLVPVLVVNIHHRAPTPFHNP